RAGAASGSWAATGTATDPTRSNSTSVSAVSVAFASREFGFRRTIFSQSSPGPVHVRHAATGADMPHGTRAQDGLGECPRPALRVVHGPRIRPNAPAPFPSRSYPNAIPPFRHPDRRGTG